MDLRDRTDLIFYCPRKPATQEIPGWGESSGPEYSYGINYDSCVPYYPNPYLGGSASRRANGKFDDWARNTILIADCSWERLPFVYQYSVHANTAGESLTPNYKLRWNFNRHFEQIGVVFRDGSIDALQFDDVLRGLISWQDDLGGAGY